jgi:hypothetical protein
MEVSGQLYALHLFTPGTSVPKIHIEVEWDVGWAIRPDGISDVEFYRVLFRS